MFTASLQVFSNFTFRHEEHKGSGAFCKVKPAECPDTLQNPPTLSNRPVSNDSDPFLSCGESEGVVNQEGISLSLLWRTPIGSSSIMVKKRGD